MKHIVISAIFAILLFPNVFIQSLPIKNGFSIKFKPISAKEEFRPRTFGALFAKISQDFSPDANFRREMLSKMLASPNPGPGVGCTNQVARVIFPYRYFQTMMNETSFLNSLRLMNLPLIKSPISDYKVLVATAPPNIKMGRGDDAKRIIVYIVFPEDTEEVTDDANLKIPEVYFVTKQRDGTIPTDSRKERFEPLLLINNNRTVTGLRSKDVAKFLKFNNQMLNHYSYNLTR